ncbi:MAG: tape measure protein [Clostridium sp.]|uniref:tape measure protein n=1 Tax=Clostridium sp. TaxID=1506 RepID=UPI0025C0584E|nr:tape measure protein [Clostridium sp.]MBS4958407.1 tape measure protein [Clostridium sp.]
MATLKAMFKLFDGYSTTIDKITKKTDQATNKILNASGATDKFNSKLNKTGASSSFFSSSLGKLAGTVLTVTTALKGMQLSDELTNTSARLNLINDGLQTQAELQEKIYASATRSRGVYTDMAGAVAKLGLTAGDSFGSNDELIAFTELIQKSFKVGGASATEQSSALLQLTQAMGSGKLQGDEFRSITENAPMIADAIAKYVGVSKGELKELSSDGAITADIIKNAMFNASNEINAQFKQMPMTFSDIWNKLKNGLLSAFTPISQAFSSMINSESFMNVINAIIIGVNILGGALGGIIDFIASGWDIIQPILIAVATVWLVQMIQKLWGMAVAVYAQIPGWLAMNAPILMVIALIAVIIFTLNQLGVTFEDIFSFVGGVLGVFVGFFYNQFVYLWNTVAAFVNFFGNVFNNPVAAVQTLFYDMAVNVLGIIEGLAQGIEDLLNKIPGVEVSITSGISGLRDRLASKSASIKDEAGLVEYVKSKEFIDYSSAATTGSSIGSNVYGNIADKLSGISNSFSSLTSGMTSNGFSGLGDLGTSSNPLAVEGTGKDGAVDVDMADEDLQYLRDIAEREYINKFSTATLAPNIQISFGDVHEEADADKVAGRIKKILQEEIALASEGVY